MNLPGFLSLGSAWLFLLLVPLVIFYFLKLKRPRMDVSSLVLWRQVINDQRVNSPFQKFKRNLLLLLQVLLLTALVLAAMQPFLATGAARARYLPVLIDCSASMAALDKPRGQSRLDVARERVSQIIADLLPDQRLSLITFNSSARQLTDFTNNKRILQDALEQIVVADLPSKIEETLRMTQALSRTVPIETVLMFSDGNIPMQVDFELPFHLNYQQLPPAGPNMGVTSLNARRSGPTSWNIFARIEGSASQQTSAVIELLQNGKKMGEETIVLDPGDSERMVFRVDTDAPSAIQIRLQPDGFDSLPSDNTAFLQLPAARDVRIYCPLEMQSYRHALDVLRSVQVFPEDAAQSTSSASFDLLISDRPEDQAPEANVSLFVGVVPDDLQELVTVQTGSGEVVDWRRTSPLLQYVELSDVQTIDEPRWASGIRAADFEQAGYDILVDGRTGPLIVEKRFGQRLAYYLLFHTDNSTLPYRVGFPILVKNAVQIAMRQASLSEVRGDSTGVLPPRTLISTREYRVTRPDGSRRDVSSNENGVVSGISAPHVGQYVISEGTTERLRIGVGLLDAKETSLATVKDIQFSELSVQAAQSMIKTDRPLWRILAMCGLCLLLVEWWLFQRRPGGVIAQ